MKQYILGIESSCDETSVAVYDYSDNKLLSNIVSSQISTHTKYGGVIKSKTVHKDVLNNVVKFFNKNNFYLQGLEISPIKGGDGNIEYISFFTNKKCENINADFAKLANIAFA